MQSIWPYDHAQQELVGHRKAPRRTLVLCDLPPWIGLDWTIGLLVSVTTMIGDLFSSFAKRRMNLAPSSMALGLDQIPEFPPAGHRLSMGFADHGSGYRFSDRTFLRGRTRRFPRSIRVQNPRPALLSFALFRLNAGNEA